MEIKSISDLYRFKLFIFDLDNTIYKEEDYLFQGYNAIAQYLARDSGPISKRVLLNKLKSIYQLEGREKLFNKLIAEFNLDPKYVSECIDLLHSFSVDEPLKIIPAVRNLLFSLRNMNKTVFILTNGNIIQQKNKVNNIQWGDLGGNFKFVFADELEPKPSPAGVEYILRTSHSKKEDTILIGDSETDYMCALNSGIDYLNVREILRYNF